MNKVKGPLYFKQMSLQFNLHLNVQNDINTKSVEKKISDRICTFHISGKLSDKSLNLCPIYNKYILGYSKAYNQKTYMTITHRVS